MNIVIYYFVIAILALVSTVSCVICVACYFSCKKSVSDISNFRDLYEDNCIDDLEVFSDET